MAKEVQQHKALRLKADVRIDHDREAVEDAGPRRLEIAILKHKSMLDDGRRDFRPQWHESVTRQPADESTYLTASADEFRPGDAHPFFRWLASAISPASIVISVS